MDLHVDVRKSFGDFSFQAEFSPASNRCGVFGPSGSGKSTLMNMIAGLLLPDDGSIHLNDTSLFESGEDLNLPPEKRTDAYRRSRAPLGGGTRHTAGKQNHSRLQGIRLHQTLPTHVIGQRLQEGSTAGPLSLSDADGLFQAWNCRECGLAPLRRLPGLAEVDFLP